MTVQQHDEADTTVRISPQGSEPSSVLPPSRVIEALTAKLMEAGLADASREARCIAEVAGEDTARMASMVERRIAGEPLELVTGRTQFLGVPLLLAPGVLVPRGETELLGRTALATLRDGTKPDARVVDMCCGAGNLACSLAHHAPGITVWASDMTTPCVETARRNVHALGLDTRVTVVQGDLFAPLRGRELEGTIDLVVCNPPYISTKRLEGERAELLRHEPREAFEAGPYGLSIHQRAIAEATAFLRPGGVFMCELGLGQARQIALLFARAKRYGAVTFARDAEGNERVAVASILPTGDA